MNINRYLSIFQDSQMNTQLPCLHRETYSLIIQRKVFVKHTTLIEKWKNKRKIMLYYQIECCWVKKNVFDNMNGKNNCRAWWWIIAYTKWVFTILLHLTVCENCRLFFIQLILPYEIGKCPKHSGSESLPLLRHCRDPMES